ncbi:hypothetical protein [Halopelagius fulvigenes]|uniref:Uncharacterized protein n=1 Tax=Halopelagius fulvigenes TaxID=1198324 RepID=A0ABD5TV08_9EURY
MGGVDAGTRLYCEGRTRFDRRSAGVTVRINLMTIYEIGVRYPHRELGEGTRKGSLLFVGHLEFGFQPLCRLVLVYPFVDADEVIEREQWCLSRIVPLEFDVF